MKKAFYKHIRYILSSLAIAEDAIALIPYMVLKFEHKKITHSGEK